METITFCLPFHGPTEHHVQLLHRSLCCIREHYPNNPILICKTSTSEVGQLPVEGVQVHTTFKDGSHIFGAMELLTRVCNTERYVLMHDSMFLIRSFPEEILQKRLFYLWHFDQGRDTHSFDAILADASFPADEVLAIKHMYASGYPRTWTGLFGPAFGGTLETLRAVWAKLGLDATNVERLAGRPGLMLSERYLSLILFHMGVVDFFEDGRKSLNGDIFNHPGVFKGQFDIMTPTETLRTLAPAAFCFKTWQFRG